MELLRVLGGRYITISWLTDKQTHYPLTFVMSLGENLKGEQLQRAVKLGTVYLDFATIGLSYRKGIMVDERLDVVRRTEQDEYVWDRMRYKLLHVMAQDLYEHPDLVRAKVLRFLAA